MHAKVSMDRGALIAQEDADVGRGPFWILALAVKTQLNITILVSYCYLVFRELKE